VRLLGKQRFLRLQTCDFPTEPGIDAVANAVIDKSRLRKRRKTKLVLRLSRFYQALPAKSIEEIFQNHFNFYSFFTPD
jgi:hypothetical protein